MYLVYGRPPIGNGYFLQKVIIFVQLLHDILLKKNDLVNFRLNVFWEPHIHFVLELEFNEMQKDAPTILSVLFFQLNFAIYCLVVLEITFGTNNSIRNLKSHCLEKWINFTSVFSKHD